MLCFSDFELYSRWVPLLNSHITASLAYLLHTFSNKEPKHDQLVIAFYSLCHLGSASFVCIALNTITQITINNQYFKS